MKAKAGVHALTRALEQICYFILFADPSETELSYTPFQSFPAGLPGPSAALVNICSLPTCIYDYFAAPQATRTAHAHALYPYWVTALQERYLANLDLKDVGPFVVVFYERRAETTVQEWAQRQTVAPLLHELRQPPLSNDRLLEHCQQAAAGSALDSFPNIQFLLENVRATWTVGHVKLPITNHNIVRPNELALLSARLSLGPVSHIPATNQNDVYADAGVRAAREVLSVRSTALRHKTATRIPPSVSLIVSTIDALPHLAPSYVRRILAKQRNKHVRLVLRNIVRPKQHAALYGNVQSTLRDPVAMHILEIRAAELACMTNAISLRAASQLSAVIRLQPPDQDCRGLVKHIAECARKEGPGHQRKINRLALRLQTKLAAMASHSQSSMIGSAGEIVQLVSDLPLEMLPVRNLPLGLRRDTFRIPNTPGSLSFSQLVGNLSPMFLSPASFAKVLILRGLKPSDRLYLALQKGLEALSTKGDLPDVRFVDVHSRRELVDEINAFEHSIMVFDGHGAHSPKLGHGVLCVGDEEIDPWDLRGEVNMPPIVIASACDTLALDVSHATSAGGLLASGARTVLATSLPVNGGHASAYVARLLMKVALHLPIIRQPVRWVSFVSQFQRQFFATELLSNVFAATAFNSQAVWNETMLFANTVINSRDPKWFEKLVTHTAKQLSISEQDIQRIRERRLALPECLRYVQVGNPDTIIVGGQHASGLSDL